MRQKKQDKRGELKFYCFKCNGATEAIQKEPTENLKCILHPTCDVLVMREMTNLNLGYKYYVNIETEARVS